MRRPSPALLVLAPAAAALLLSGCTSPTTGEAAGADPISVVATDTTCTLSATSAPAGPTTFAITNSGGQMTEFYIYDEAGSKIITEKPNIGPGISATLVYDFAPGTYTTACRPNGAGAGMRAAFTVAAGTGTGTVSQAAPSAELTSAVATYRSYIESETAALIPATEQFAAAVRTGELARAKALFPAARQHYERIEPVAETFVDLDYAIDIREDGVEDGRPWTGWHAIEKILWVKNTTKGAEAAGGPAGGRHQEARRRDPRARAHAEPDRQRRLRADGGGRGRQGDGRGGPLLPHRHLGLRGQRGGSEGAFEALEQAARAADATLAERIEAQFSALEAELAALKTSDGGYPLYTELSKAQVKTLSDDVNALSEPLSRLTGGRRAMSAPSLDPAGTPAGSEQGRGFSRRTARACRRAALRRRCHGPGGAGRLESPGLTRVPSPAAVVPVPRRAPGRHRHPGPGPAALRRVRRDDAVARRSWSSLLKALDRRGRPDDPGPPGRRRRARRRCRTTRRPTTPARRSACRRRGLTLTFGFGPALFRDADGRDRFGLADRQPGALRRPAALPGRRPRPGSVSGGDLCVQACADDPQVAVHAIRNLARIGFGTVAVRWSQLGFGRTSSTSTSQSTPRNLFGFKDGTANVKAEETADLDEHVWVAARRRPAAWLAGGLLPRRAPDQHASSRPGTAARCGEQEQVIGRTKGEGAPLSGGTEFTEPDLAMKGRDGAADPGRLARRGWRTRRSNNGVAAAAPRLQLRRRHRRARPPRRRPVLHRLRARPAHALHPAAAQAGARATR